MGTTSSSLDLNPAVSCLSDASSHKLIPPPPVLSWCPIFLAEFNLPQVVCSQHSLLVYCQLSWIEYEMEFTHIQILERGSILSPHYSSHIPNRNRHSR